MDGLQKHRLRGVMEGGKAHRAMQALPEQVGVGQVTQQTRQRVGDAIRAEGAGAVTRDPSRPLSKHYEGYMTDSKASYTPEHVERVMGLQPGQHKPKDGPTAFMKPREQTHIGSGSSSQSVSDVTAISRPKVPPHMVPTVRPPAMGARV